MAKHISDSIEGHKRSTEITCHLGSALVAMGAYREAGLLLQTGGYKKNDVHITLLQSKVAMYTGKVKSVLKVFPCYIICLQKKFD